MKHNIDVLGCGVIYIDNERVFGSKPYGLFSTVNWKATDEDLKRIADRCLEVISDCKTEPTISKMEQVDEPTEITYQNCSDTLLKMWMDNVLTDAEYNRIMDKLNNAQRNDEPSNSEKPNNCEACRFELYCPEMCEGCCEWDSHYEPNDKPQIDDDKKHCVFCKWVYELNVCSKCKNMNLFVDAIEDELQTERNK